MTELVQAGAARAYREARRFLDGVLESPVAEADARDAFAAWRVGVSMMLLVALVAIAAFWAGGAYFTGVRPLPELVARHGLGALLMASLQIAVTAFFTLVVPARAGGLLEGPRWRSYFDQVVASGIAPWRYFAGRFLAAQTLIGVTLAAILPVVAIFWLVDSPPLGRVLESWLLVVAYAELLLAVALGLGVLMHEAAAVPLTSLLGILVNLVAWLPLPSALVAVAPVRAIVAPFATGFNDIDAALFASTYGAAQPFGISIPYLPYALGVTFTLGLLALLPCVFGPAYAFVPGFNNFGAVVLPGDRSRAAFRRIRPVLQRRTELAFFFENRGPALTTLAPWARLLVISGFLLVLGAIFAGSFASTVFARTIIRARLDEHDVCAVLCIALAPVLCLGPYLYATTKNDAQLDLRLLRLRIPLVLADVAAFGLVLAVLVVLTLGGLATLAPMVVPARGHTTMECYEIAAEWACLLSVVSMTALLLQKSFGLRAHGRSASAAAAIGLVCLAPVVLALRSPRDLQDRDDLPPRTAVENARILTAMHLAWPFRLTLSVREETLDDVRIPSSGAWRWLAFNGFWVIYPAFDVLQLAIIVTLLRRRRQEAVLELEQIRQGAAS
ncbi:MAG TPA: hypothetical protein VFF73_22195 [Planctomycetota bacterium]|nr:hypothetical protein [Planctomycetota bacterium]